MAPEKFLKYPSKIILFGEYLVLSGGNAISIPYSPYSLVKTFTEKSNKPFYFNLYNHMAALPEFEGRIISKFKKEIYSGLHFVSTIPIGYGLGSSGALVANIYHDYIKEKKTDLLELKRELGLIENFFHQESSGLDPLTSYIKKPLLVVGNSISTIDTKMKSLNKFHLYDSGIKRPSKNAIAHFTELSKDPEFKKGLNILSNLNNMIIVKLISGGNISEDMKNFSMLQLNLFWDFIPEEVQKLWERGINLDSYYMKLCGAGMGGMFLAYSENTVEGMKRLKT